MTPRGGGTPRRLALRVLPVSELVGVWLGRNVRLAAHAESISGLALKGNKPLPQA